MPIVPVDNSATPAEVQKPTADVPAPVATNTSTVTPATPIQDKGELGSIYEDRPSNNGPVSVSQVRESSGELNSIYDEGGIDSNISVQKMNAVAPDNAARILKMEAKTGLPTDFIKENLDEVEQNATNQNFDDAELRKNNPKLAAWIAKNPMHYSLVKDDLGSASDMEKIVKDHGFATQALNVLYSGMASAGYNASKIPEALATTLMVPGNALSKAFGYAEVKIPESIRNNPVSDYYKKSSEYYNQLAPEVSTDTWEEIKKGNFTSAGRGLALQIINNAPSQLINIAAALATGGTSAMVVAGSMSAGQKMSEMDNPDASPSAVGLDAAYNGAIEALFENLGTLGVVKKWEGAITRRAGKAVSKEVFKDLGKTLAYSVLGEWNEETLTSMAQDFSDYATGVNPDALKGMWGRAINAGLVGAASGGLMTSPASIGAASVRQQQVKQANINKDFFLALGDSVSNSKIKDRLPEKLRDLVGDITADGLISDVYMSTDSIDSYFQSKNLNPVKVMQEMGLLNEYQEAKEHGADLRVPLATMASGLAGTEHMKGLASDIKFSPDQVSVNEAKTYFQNDEQKVLQEASAEDTGMKNYIEKTKSSRQMIEGNVVEQLKNAGQTNDTARANAKLMSSVFVNLGERTGQDPVALFNKYGLKVNKVDEATGGGDIKITPAKKDTTNYSEADYINSELQSMQEEAALAEIQNNLVDVGQNSLEQGKKFQRVYNNTYPSWYSKAKVKNKENLMAALEKKSGPIYNRLVEIAKERLTNGYEEARTRNVPNNEFRKMMGLEQIDVPEEYLQTKSNEPVQPFYSKIQRAVESKVPDNASKAQVIGSISDIKEEERKWSGIDEFLKDKEKVSKKELMDFLKMNELEIESVVKSNSDLDSTIAQGKVNNLIDELDEEQRRIRQVLTKANLSNGHIYNLITAAKRNKKIDKEYPQIKWDILRKIENDLADAKKALDAAITKEESNRPKFDKYTLPGGEYYRELLFTLPANPSLSPDESKELDDLKKIPLDQATTEQRDRRIALTIKNSTVRDKAYRSNHFDERNILAHTRLNDRIDADGNKVLFIEEIQSDWHQEGRKKGYRLSQPQISKLDQRRLEIESIGKQATPEQTTEWVGIMNQLNENNNAIQDAPFKKTWHEFVLKKLIRYASENGYQKIAWTTGEQQAERYDLSKQVESVAYNKATKTLGIWHNGALITRDVEPENLEGVLGKELAQKILSSEDNYRQYSGIDLRVGGEGMKGFYDKIIPNFLNNFTKKYGAKTKDVAIEGQVVHSLEITPALKDAALNEGFSLFQNDSGSKLGRITFGSDRQFSIDLFKDANLSTFLHESGHFYLEVLGDLATDPNATKQIKDDYKELLNFLGVNSREEIQTEHHEKWARAFESYLMSGEAPSNEMRSLFAKFKVWLTSIYRQLTALDVTLSDEVKGVMNRLIATDEQIQEKAATIPNLFTNPVGILGETDGNRYIAAIEENKALAEEYVSKKFMDDIRKEKKKFWKEEEKRITPSIKDTVSQEPVYRLISAATEETPLGDSEFRISKQDLISKYGVEFFNSLKNKYIFSSDAGVYVDLAAEIYGVSDAKQFMLDIGNAVPIDEKVKQLVSEELNRRFPDIMTEQDIPEEAIKALHNQKRSYILRKELEYMFANNPTETKGLIRKITRRVPSDREVKAYASQIIGKENLKNIKPNIYYRAEVKNARMAGELFAKGDFDGAFEAKRKEYLNHELYMSALEATDNMTNSFKDFKKFNKKNDEIVKTRDSDIVNAGRAILAAYGLGKKGKSPIDFLAQIKDYDKDMYENISAIISDVMSKAKDISAIDYNTFVAMKDTLDALWSLAKTEREMEIRGNKVLIDSVKEELGLDLSTRKPYNTDAGYTRARTKWENIKIGLLGWFAAGTRVEGWVDAMDKGDINGIYRKYIFEPISQAATQYRIKKAEVTTTLRDIIKENEKSFTNDKIQASELGDKGFEFTNKSHLIGALLHTGNESNFQKLIRGYKWGDYDAEGKLDSSRWDSFIRRMIREGTITKSDFDFCQKVWDLFESQKPEAQRVHKQMYGYYFSEITSNEISNELGNWKGGYIPAKADPSIVEDADIRNEKELLEKMGNSFMFPSVSKGFTKNRVEGHAAPLLMDVKLIPMFLDSQLKFTYMGPAVRNVARLIWDKKLRSSLSSFDPSIAKSMLVPWLQRSGEQRVTTGSTGDKTLDKFLTHARTNAGMGIMTINLTNALQQYTGLAVTAVKVKPKYLRNALFTYTKSRKESMEMIIEKSDFMKTRSAIQIFDISSDIEDMLINPTKYERSIDFMKKNGYILAQATQNFVDTISWIGAYEQAVEEGIPEAQAVESADSVIRTTQGSFNAEDISRTETGTPMHRIFTMFYSYFNMLANLQKAEFIKSIGATGLKKGYPRMLYAYTMGMMLPAVMAKIITEAMSGRGIGDDDDEDWVNDFMKLVMVPQAESMMATLPGAGQIAVYGMNLKDDKWYNDKLSTSPALSQLESAVKGAVLGVPKALTGEAGKMQVKDILTAISLFGGVPVAPLGKPIGYLMDYSDDKINPTGPIDFARGLMTGKGKK